MTAFQIAGRERTGRIPPTAPFGAFTIEPRFRPKLHSIPPPSFATPATCGLAASPATATKERAGSRAHCRSWRTGRRKASDADDTAGDMLTSRRLDMGQSHLGRELRPTAFNSRRRSASRRSRWRMMRWPCRRASPSSARYSPGRHRIADLPPETAHESGIGSRSTRR